MRASEASQNEPVSFERDGSKERVLKIEQIGMSSVPNTTLYWRSNRNHDVAYQFTGQEFDE